MLVFIHQMCDIQPRLLTFQLKTQVVNSSLNGNLMVLWHSYLKVVPAIIVVITTENITVDM